LTNQIIDDIRDLDSVPESSAGRSATGTERDRAQVLDLVELEGKGGSKCAPDAHRHLIRG
jgi:hypothetical protein